VIETSSRSRRFRPIKRPDGPLNSVDKTVWSVAQMWNQQEDDDTTSTFLWTPSLHERSEILSSAIYRYHVTDQWRVAEDLRKMADAIYAAVSPWVR